MENIKTSLLMEEIYFNSTILNYGVGSKNNTPKNIYKSFTPFSSNQKISFCNTIMIPYITTESSIDTEKNKSQDDKNKISIRKDNTRMKTESSKDEKNNISCEKQITKIIIENEIEKIEENTEEKESISKELKEKKEILEKNPYFSGGCFPFDINQFNNNSEIEKKKVEKLLNKNNYIINKKERSLHSQTPKNLKKEKSIEDKLTYRIKRMESFNKEKIKNNINHQKEETEKKIKKRKTKNKESNNNSNKISEKNLHNKDNKSRSYKRKRESTIVNKSPLVVIKDNNIKAYKASLFIKNSSSNLETKGDSNIIKDTKDEKEKNIKNKKKKIKYNGFSHKLFNLVLEIEKKEDNKISKKKTENMRKKESQIKEQDNKNLSLRLNKKQTSFVKNRNKKYKTLRKEFNNKIEKKKVLQNTYRKNSSETIKKVDFELELKNKNNLTKTQFNLFSPDKFTNTEFCGSDYCEYTLECMNIILKRDRAQKQQKSKVNFNFPKTKGNKKKKIALFDLDETLVHCTGDITLNKDPYQHCIEIILPGNKETKVGINIRPLWKKSLNSIKKNYHIVVFTASHQAYADAVLNFMDPNNKYFKYRLYRNNCSLVDVDGVKFYVKDLDIFDEYYDLKDIIIVDNSALSFIFHLENGVPIVPYYNEDNDDSLNVVGLYLNHIFKENDLREANKKYINLQSFLKEAKMRNDEESIIKEESTNNEKGNNEEDKIDINHIKRFSNKSNDIDIKKEKEKEKNNVDKINKRRCSYSIESSQHRLISQSKLFNIYYEIKSNKSLSYNKNEEIIEEKSNKSFSSSEEEIEIKEHESKKSVSELFFKRRMLNTVEKPIEIKRNINSNKVLSNYFDLKTIHSNFYNKFSDVFPNK